MVIREVKGETTKSTSTSSIFLVEDSRMSTQGTGIRNLGEVDSGRKLATRDLSILFPVRALVFFCCCCWLLDTVLICMCFKFVYFFIYFKPILILSFARSAIVKVHV